MKSSGEPFKSDCEMWLGYKPCIVQQRTKQPDCIDCFDYSPLLTAEYENEVLFEPEQIVEARTIGIVEMGGLGSILRSTAVSAAIRDVNPNASLSWFTHSRGVELLKYVPGVNPVDIEASHPSLYESQLEDVDLVVNFEHGVAARELLSSARNVGGFAVNKAGNIYGVRPHAEYMQRMQIDDSFRAINNLSMQEVLLKTIGLHDVVPRYDIEISRQNRIKGQEILEDLYFDSFKQAIGLNIGTSEKGSLRRWPATHFSALAERLSEEHPEVGVLILSGPDDSRQRREVAALLPESRSNLAFAPHDLEVGDFLGLVSKLDLVVSSDTFGFHAAKSQSVQTIVLAGPMPHKELELSQGDELIGPTLDCAPCYHNCVQPVLGLCMNEISVGEVYGAVEARL